MRRRLKRYATGVGGIVTSRLSTSGNIGVCKRFDVAPGCCDVAELTGLGCGWMVCRFVRVAVTPDAGAIGLNHITVIERQYELSPVTGDMAGFTQICSDGVLHSFFRRRVASGTDAIGL